MTQSYNNQYCTIIRNATIDDAAEISAIYNHYVLHTTVTFEEEPVSPIQMAKRIAEVQSRYPWLLYECDGLVAGYAYGSAWKARSAYRHTAETSVYLAPSQTGKGIGRKLYTELINKLQGQHIHLLIGGIALPNEASIRLHESMGFTKTGQFTEVGLKFGQWADVGYWELNLEKKFNNNA